MPPRAANAARTALQRKFLGLLRNSSEPVADARVRDYFTQEGKGEYERLPEIINTLLAEGQIKLFQTGEAVSYSAISAEEAERVSGLPVDHRMVLTEIERAGNKGIWTRDIRTQTNIPQQAISKALKALEARRLIKLVKSISNKNKKLYMLYDLVPSAELTGGPWYNEQEFDYDFINQLSTFVHGVIKASNMTTAAAITDKVHESGISKIALGPEEIRSIIQKLIYDGRVEEVRNVRLPTHETYYKVSNEISTFNFLTETPCGVCPVIDQCQAGNVISPRSCLYISKWVDLKDLDF